MVLWQKIHILSLNSEDMKNSFLQSVTKHLYDKYGDSISNLKIVLPNRRSILFFNDALSQISTRPIWQPHFISIDELMGKISGLTRCERIRAITELFKVYSAFHKNEDFDSFYFWGEILLNDFDAIDKYQIDALMLFRNLTDLKNLDNDLSYLTPEQQDLIKRFWQSFDIKTKTSKEQENFLRIWDTLASIYTKFRNNLTDNGVGYTGLIQRTAAEKILSEEYTESAREHYVVIGFNALSQCEKVLFDYLKKNHDTDFYWDYDDYYLNKEQEAGLFIRENMVRFPQSEGFIIDSDFADKKEFNAIATISDSMQCKYVAEFLSNIYKKDGKLDKNTAIILADESLLMPVLYSLPDYVDTVNITMGFPLRQSLAYTFVERLFLLQNRMKTDKDGTPTFYHSDVEGILTSPYIKRRTDTNNELYDQIIKEGRIYVSNKRFQENTLLSKIFSPITDWKELAEYVIYILSEVAVVKEVFVNKTERLLQQEMINLITDNLRMLVGSLNDCNIPIDTTTFNSIARRLLQSLRVPFSGEPLSGVQIMGILETRNLDFDNVLLVSMNDDTFPAGRAGDSSYVPYNLRFAYGLPTPEHHEGVYAYYFYRLVQRCKRVDMVYCARNDERSSGEQSRYIYQLEYESPHSVNRINIATDVNLTDTEDIVVEKTDECQKHLNDFLNGIKQFSPSSFNGYLECPLKFYFRSIIGLKPKDEIAEDIDLPMFGTILHRAMELLYTPLLNRKNPNDAIAALINSDSVIKAIDFAINENFYHGKSLNENEYAGNVLMVRESVKKYINECILPYDAKNAGCIIGLEKPIKSLVRFTDNEGQEREVIFAGKSDRIDLMNDNTIRIIDYKTGSPHQDFKEIVSLLDYSSDQSQKNAVTQTFLYSMMVDKMQRNGEFPGKDVCPSLYYVRRMSKEDFSPLLNDKSQATPVLSYSQYKEALEEQLQTKLTELFDTTVPFKQTEDINTCEYCDFSTICNRK